MRKRRRPTLEINLDPLTDLVANSVGIVIFVLVFGVLSARGVDVELPIPVGPGSPLRRETTKQRVEFDCNGGLLRRYDLDALVRRCHEACGHPSFHDMPAAAERVNRAGPVLGDHFQARPVFTCEETAIANGRRRRLVLKSMAVEPRPDQPGASPAEVSNPAGSYQTWLSQLDTERHYLLFRVDAGSLDVFRAARVIALAQGFDVGWDLGRRTWPEFIRLVSQAEAEAGRAGARESIQVSGKL